jgi:hypothetical protein
MPNMIWRSRPEPTWEATAPVIQEKNLSASSGQAATHNASRVNDASRTQEYR